MRRHVAASTQNQALAALLFLYREVLERKYLNASREWGWQWVFPASMIYTHVLNRGGRGVVSPADRL